MPEQRAWAVVVVCGVLAGCGGPGDAPVIGSLHRAVEGDPDYDAGDGAGNPDLGDAPPDLPFDELKRLVVLPI